MSIQRRLYERMAKLDQEKDIQEGPAHQNPLKTAYGGMKAAQNTPSMKAYHAQVKKDQAARGKKIEQERKDGVRSKYESVEQVDEKEGTYADKKRNKRHPARDMRKAPDGSPTDGYYAKGDGSHGRREPSKYSALGRRRRVEDVEQVDEVSSDTLRSYVHKRRGQVQSDLNTGKHSPKTNKKAKGVSAALSRLDARDPKGYFYGDKALAREDVEQVDELKRDTLGSYADKARGDIEGIKNVLKAKKLGPVSDKHRADLERELANRTKGRKTAIGKKYTREDAEQVDELKMPEKDKRGRAKDPVIGAALERGSRRADLKAHGKLRRGDTDGAEGHMTRSRKRQAASRTPVEEAKVGDTVHLGHASKGGSGVKGKVVKIDGKMVHLKNDKGDMFKGPMNRVTVGEAIKYDSAGDSTGTVTGKGKRDRRAGGEVKVTYKGSDTYKDGAKLPIKARDIGRLIKTARKKGTTPYDSRNLKNPRLTDEGVEDMTAAQERDRQHRDNPTRKTVANVKLPSTDKERERYVKKYQSDKAGKPGKTKPRKMRDLQMRLRGPK